VSDPQWKIGVEIELLAPKGSSRLALAEALAEAHDGAVRHFLHPQAEPSEVPDLPLFHNLTQGFEVLDADAQPVARLVDDVTLQDDLDRSAAPLPGWYRIVGDDPRLLRLVTRHCEPTDDLEHMLQPVAALFGTEPEAGPGGMRRIHDGTGASIAIGARLPGERERTAELITPPIETDHFSRLEALLEPARRLGFTAPLEGAVHIHFDAAPLCSAPVFRRMVQLLTEHGPGLKQRFKTNPRCRRLGPWPDALFDVVEAPDFADLSWPDALSRLDRVQGLSKYCDFNVMNIVGVIERKHTLEARIFPVWMHAEPILEAATAVAELLKEATDLSV